MLDPDEDGALGAWLEEVQAQDAAWDGVPRSPAETLAYGERPEQVVDLWVPASGAGGPLVISLHGGYFEAEFDRSLHVPIVRRLLADSFSVANVEYRRIGSGGGPEESVADVHAAVDAVAERLAPPAIAVFGHSAGGYLCGALAAHPRVDLVVPLAAVSDPAGAARAGWDEGSIARWIAAGAVRHPEGYEVPTLGAQPRTGAEHLVVHGVADTVVGVEQSRVLVEARLRAGDRARLVELEGEGHYGFLDPREAAFGALREGLLRWRDAMDGEAARTVPHEQ